MKPRLFVGGVSEAEIVALEAELGVRLPDEYRKFLADYGAGVVGDTEVYGLGTKEPGPPNLRWLLAQLPARGFVRPKELVPFAELGNKDLVALVCAPFGGFEVGSVVFWPGGSQSPELAALSLAAWLSR